MMNILRTKHVLFVLTMLVLVAAAPVYAVDNLGLFELDYNGPNHANALDDGNAGLAGGDDWDVIYLGAPAVLPLIDGVFINDTPSTGKNDNVLTGGGTKDDIDFPSWKWKTAKPTPDKNNITNAFTAAYQSASGDLIMYFGADRFANNGDAQIGFWFLQGDVAPTGVTDGAGGFSGNHMDGDVLVLANFLNGGVVGDVNVYKWCTGCGDFGDINLKFQGTFGECDGSGQEVCALNNSGEVDTGGWPYEPKFGTADMIPDNSLFEGGINISSLIGPVCLTTFMAESRSSQSTDAVLKDFAMEQIQVCGFDVAKECSADVAASGGGLDVSFWGTVDNTGAGSLFMTVSDDMGDIEDVCFDDYPVATPDGECTDDDSDPADLSIDLGVATFSLLAGESVRYEGSYTAAGDEVTYPNLNGNAEVTDIVTAEGRADAADPDPIDTKTAEATCDTPVDGEVTISKDCTAVVNSAGDKLNVSVTGSGANTGDIVLTSITLTDTDSEVVSSLSILKNGNPVLNSAFDLAPGDAYSYIASATEDDSLSHYDMITVSGTNAFTNSAETATDDADCADPHTPSISVTKDCSVELDFSNTIDTIQLKVPFSGKICNTGNLKLTSLTASDSDAGTISLDREWLAPTGDAGGMDCLDYSGFYRPEFADILSEDTNPANAEFTDEVTVNATAALAATADSAVSDDAEATCRLCPVCEECTTD